jgi:hypothetical protein
MTPIKSIRKFCLEDCCAGDVVEHRECHLSLCPLHQYRLGHNPNIKPKNLTDEQKAVVSARFAAARMAKKA